MRHAIGLCLVVAACSSQQADETNPSTPEAGASDDAGSSIQDGGATPDAGADARPPLPTGPIALVTHASSGSGTTSGVDTAGGTFAVVCAQANKTISDSNHNGWTYLSNSQGGYAGSTVGMYVAYGLVTSANHAFHTNDGSPLTVAVFSNVASADQEAETGSLTQYPQVVGPVTPLAPGELAFGCTDGNYGATVKVTVQAPYSVLDTALTPAGNNGVTSAFAILGSGTPTPTQIAFNSSENNGQASNLATFRSVKSAVPPSVTLSDPVPEGAVHVAYKGAACPATSNGVQPYTYAITGGSLPAGMTLDPKTGCLGGTPGVTATDEAYTLKVTDQAGNTATASTHVSVAAMPITLAGSTCPVAKQLKPYSCTALQATGGIGALHYSASTDPSFEGLPGGMSVDPNSGTISASIVMDQGNYSNVGFQAVDEHGGAAQATIALDIDGDNTFGGVKLFPDDSVYHLKVRDLPNDTSIRGAVPAYYAAVPLQAEFGPDTGTGGMPINTYAASTPFVPVKTDNGGNQFTSAPIPCTAGMEGDRNQLPISEVNGEPDLHTLGVYLPGTGADGMMHSAQLFELYNTYPLLDSSGSCSWGNPKDAMGGGYGSALFPRPGGPDTDVQTTHEMPNPGATVDAAGLPVAPLLVNYDEVAGGCAAGSECGVIRHPIRITVSKLGQFYQWPATASAPQVHDSCPQSGFGGGDIQPWDQASPLTCYDGSGNAITSPGNTAVVAGQVLHLPPGTAEPPACAATPVTHILFQALMDYGVIAADNGLTGRIIGTKDNRWPAWGTLNACLTQITMGQLVVANVSVAAVDPHYGSNQIQGQYVSP